MSLFWLFWIASTNAISNPNQKVLTVYSTYTVLLQIDDYVNTIHERHPTINPIDSYFNNDFEKRFGLPLSPPGPGPEFQMPVELRRLLLLHNAFPKRDSLGGDYGFFNY